MRPARNRQRLWPVAAALPLLAAACGEPPPYVGVPAPICAETACAPVLVATGQDNPIALAVSVSGDTLYWLNYGSGIGTGGLMSVPAAGGNPSMAVSGLTRPVALAVDADAVYWAESGLEPYDGRIFRLPLADSVPSVLAAGLLFPSWIAVTGGVVYFREEGSGRIASVPSMGGDVTTLATGRPGAGSVALGPEGIYWMGTGDAYTGGDPQVVSLSGGEPQPRGAGFQSGTAIAADDGGVYQAFDMFGGSIGRVWPLAANAPQPDVLAWDQPLPGSLIASGGRLFWSDASTDGAHGSIMMLESEQLRSPAVPPVTLAWQLPGPGALIVSGGVVYWTNRGTPSEAEDRSQATLVAHGSIMAAPVPPP